MAISDPVARSTSMPARPHPLPQSVDEELSKLKAWAAPLLLLRPHPASPPTAQVTAAGLAAIASFLYDSVDKLLASPHGQQAVRRCRGEKSPVVTGLLDASVRLLDVCGTARDSLGLIRERAKDVQSALRRRCPGPAAVDAYVRARASARKDAARCLKSLKQIDQYHGGGDGDANASSSMVMRVLQEARAICVSFLQSLLSSMSSPSMSAGSKGGSRPSRWSLVSRAMLQRGTKLQLRGGMEELERVDDLVLVGSFQHRISNTMITGKKGTAPVDAAVVETLQKQLGVLDAQLVCLEDALERMFRGLIQNRVSLLNILSSN